MKVLLLAGTGDARRIAEKLVELAAVELVASLAGVTRSPLTLPCETRIGGFGGVDGFRTYLIGHGFDAVVDATHPFAQKMTQTAVRVCNRLNMPYLQMLRPEWQAQAGDHWVEINQEQEARDHIAKGSTVFLATGRQTLPAFENLGDCRLICRQIDPPDQPFPYPNGEFLMGRPPFSVEEEIALFSRLKVQWLVVKNSGGQASRSKLDAARHLEIPVLMIARPAPADGNRVASVGQVVDWVHTLRGET